MPYTSEFRAEIDSLLDRHEPEPGPHEEMLYRAGTRNGLLLVKQIISDIEHQIRGEEE